MRSPKLPQPRRLQDHSRACAPLGKRRGRGSGNLPQAGCSVLEDAFEQASFISHQV